MKAITQQCTNLGPSGFGFDEKQCAKCKQHLGNNKCSYGPEQEWQTVESGNFNEVGIPRYVMNGNAYWDH